ncbi:MAG TPA: hypothetical protein VHE30_20090 [Polyangiaceae bacterium]|nr:hypothetical protein [Polyangiaceae bacterium]
MKKSRVLMSLVSLTATGSLVVVACSSDDQAGSSPTPQVDAGGNQDSGGTSACGDGVVGAGEKCDTKIAAGKTGACPTVAACDDDDPCTVNAVSGAACSAVCDYSAKVTATTTGKDQCCPAGATAATDSDCSANCGNGKVDTGETCDTKITSGTGACQTSCTDDGDPCTTETLVTADPCNPRCTKATITTAKDGDQCCPSGATAANDSDCSASCGNGTVEAGEDCDETSDACQNCKWVPTAFRFTSLTVAEPRLTFGDGTPQGCSDITIAVNLLINNSFNDDKNGLADGGPDGKADLSFLLVARPLDQTGSRGTGEFLSKAICDAPTPSTTCAPDPGTTGQASAVTNQSTGACLTPNPDYFGTPDASVAVPNTPTAGAAGCFASAGRKLDLTISGIPLTFETARISAEWDANPATGMTNGVIEAFMSTAQAKAIILPPDTPLVGGQPLSTLLRGTSENTCVGVDDQRLGPDGTTMGYWFYFNFEAQKVAWTGN